MLLGFVLACLSVQSVMKGTAAVALVLPLLVLGVPFVDLFLIVWRRWRRGVPFYSAGQDHVHHDLVLVHGFSQRKSVLLLYSWCLLLSGAGHRHAARQQDRHRRAGDRRRRRDRVHGPAPQPLPLAPRGLPDPTRPAVPGKDDVAALARQGGERGNAR